MHTFEHTVEIAAPIDQVIAFGLDPENWTRTTPSLTNVEIVEETDDGMDLTATWRMLGMSFDGEMELDIVDPEHAVTSFESPGLVGELHYHFSETESGTEVVQRAEYEFGDSLLERIIEPVAARYNKRQFKHSLETMKELIEAEATATIEA